MLIMFDFVVDFGLKDYKCEWNFTSIFVRYTNNGGVSDLRMRKEVAFEFCWSNLETLDLDNFLTRFKFNKRISYKSVHIERTLIRSTTNKSPLARKTTSSPVRTHLNCLKSISYIKYDA